MDSAPGSLLSIWDSLIYLFINTYRVCLGPGGKKILVIYSKQNRDNTLAILPPEVALPSIIFV